MKKFEDKQKQDRFQALVQNKQRVSYRLLRELESLEMIEDYDLFRIISNQFNNMYMFYMDGEFYVIDSNRDNFRQIERSLLQTRCYEIQPNKVQGLSEEEFLKLSTAELIQVMLGEEIEEER